MDDRGAIPRVQAVRRLAGIVELDIGEHQQKILGANPERASARVHDRSQHPIRSRRGGVGPSGLLRLQVVEDVEEFERLEDHAVRHF